MRDNQGSGLYISRLLLGAITEATIATAGPQNLSGAGNTCGRALTSLVESQRVT